MKPAHRDALLGPKGCLAAALADGEAVALRLSGGCMEPILADGSSVRIARARLYLPGDVVAFHCRHQDRLLAHRLLGYVRRRGAWKLMTKADAADRPDPFADHAQVLGKVVAWEGRRHSVSLRLRAAAILSWIHWTLRLTLRRRR